VHQGVATAGGGVREGGHAPRPNALPAGEPAAGDGLPRGSAAAAGLADDGGVVALLEEATGPGTWYVDPCCDDHFPQAMRRDIGQAKNKLLAAERS